MTYIRNRDLSDIEIIIIFIYVYKIFFKSACNITFTFFNNYKVNYHLRIIVFVNKRLPLDFKM